MSVQFIFGGSGYGKTTEMISRITADAAANPEKNYYVIVPEQSTAATQQRLVAAGARHGILNIDVLSFARLAHRVFEEKGMLSKIILDDIGKNLLLQRAAAACADRLQVLGGGVSRPGTISEIKSVLSEFMQYGIDEDCLDDLIDSLPPSQNSLIYKLKDLRILLGEFRRRMGERYLTREELLRVLARCIPESRILKDSVIAFDGYTGFTPVQREVIRELAGVCERIIVTVCIGSSDDPYDYHDLYERFGMSKLMTRQIRGLAHDVCGEEPEAVRITTSHTERKEIFKFLEKYIFDDSSDCCFDADLTGQLDLIGCRDGREEAMVAARTIMKLMIDHRDWHYRDIAVITGDMEGFSENLDQIFTRFGIPHFIDYKHHILDNAFVETVRALFELERNDYSRAGVLRFLRAGFSGFSNEQIDTLENCITAEGIRGFSMWNQPWDDADIDPLRKDLIGRLGRFHEVAVRGQETVLWWTQSLYEFLESEQMLNRLQQFADELAEDGSIELAQEYGQVYSALIHVFDQMTELTPDQIVTFAEYERMLDAGLADAKVGIVPKTHDDVLIGDLTRTRLGDTKALIILGAGASNMPGNVGQKGLLNRWDREAFDRENIELSPGAKEKTYAQEFYLYQHLTKPTDYLCLTWPSAKPDGKPEEASYLIEEIRARCPQLTVKSAEILMDQPEGITALYGIDYLSANLQRQLTGGSPVNPMWRALAHVLKDDERFGFDFYMMIKAGTYSRIPERLDQESTRGLYGDYTRRSISQIQQYAACPYKHFLQYGLRLQENEVFGFELNDFGDVFHAAIEHYGRIVREEGLRWQDVDPETRERFCDRAIAESGLDRGSGVLLRSARNAYQIEQIRRLVHRSVDVITRQFEAGLFEPHAYELNFGSGKIDRLDVYEDQDHVYLKVLDYKTGSQRFSPVREYYGLQLQLPLYMAKAVEEFEDKTDKEIIPAAMFYYQVDDPFVEAGPGETIDDKIQKILRVTGVVNSDRSALDALDQSAPASSTVAPFGINKDGTPRKADSVKSREDLEVMMRYAANYVESRGRMIADGRIEVSPYRMGSNDRACKYCPYRNICGFDSKIEPYRELEKIENETAIAKMKEAACEQD